MRIDREFYTSHINDYEKIVKMNRILDKIEIVLNRHIIQNTDFLDPYETHLAQSILNSFPDISYCVSGGYKDAERNIIVLWPDYLNYSHEMEAIKSFKLTYANEELSHKDFLGSLLSLGIIREKIGDILVHKDHAYIILKKEISDFIMYNLEKIKNQRVNISQVGLDQIEVAEIKYKEIQVFVSSLRLDSLISASYNLSRKDSLNIIEAQQVKVNWELIDKPAREVKPGDIISVRRYGRLKLEGVIGYSKRGRVRCLIRILI